MNDREWQSMEETLRSLRQEEADPEIYAAVRARTLARVRPASGRRWTWALAAAAVLLLVSGVALWKPRVETRPAPVVLARAPSVPAIPEEKPKPVIARRVKTKPAARPESMKIQFLTDDPDIVIVWLVGEEGDLE